MTDVREEVLIRRPRAQVAAYMFDPAHDAEWTSGVLEAHPRQPGPLRPGARVERVARFAGRRFAYEYEVTEAEEGRWVEMRVAQPFPMYIRYELQDAPEGTLASIHARGQGTGFFRVAAPLLDGMVRRNIRKDLQNLRERLERPPS